LKHYVLLLLFLLGGCSARIPGFFGVLPFSSGQIPGALHFSNLATFATYTCQAITITASQTSGTPWIAPQNTVVSLSGLGQGNAYANQNDCKSGTNSTQQVFITAGNSQVTFYYRTSSAESLSLRASASYFESAEKTASSSLFRVLGQPSVNETYGRKKGLYGPQGIYSDGTRLFVSDTQNNRVLIWNTLPTSASVAPDVVLGQTNFYNNSINSGGISASSLNLPIGITGDGTRLFVCDTSNNRVLIWNTIPTTNGKAADLVIGQPGFTSNSPGTNADNLNGPSSISVDSNQIYIADSGNNRVLKWNTLPNSNGQSANIALGQPDLISDTANNGGISETTLSVPSGVSVNGNKIFIADSGNNRVLFWNTTAVSTQSPADGVLGQTDFISSNSNAGGVTSDSSLYNPSSLFFDGTRVYVNDYLNYRIIVWDNLVSSSTATFVIGQSDFVQNGLNAASASTPSGSGAVWSDGQKIYLADSYNNRILIWNAIPTTNGSSANNVLGQIDFGSNATTYPEFSSLSISTISHAYSDGTRLFAVDRSNRRVLIWNTLPTSDSQTPDVVLGQVDFTSMAAGVTSASLGIPISVYSDGTKLFICDSLFNRVLIWNTIPTTNNQSADVVLGQSLFTTNTSNLGGLSSSSLSSPSYVIGDGQRLYVSDSGNNRILIWNSYPTTNKQAADVVLGQSLFTTGVTNNGGISASSLSSPQGLFIEGTRLYAADMGNHRVLIWNTIPTSNFQAANLVLGQPNFTSNGVGVTSSTLGNPRGVHGDGMHLFVSDTSYNRVLVWNSPPTSNQQAADSVVGQINFTSSTANSGGLSATSLDSPYYLFGDGARILISDYNNGRLLVVPIPGI
jgi:sugar lactone lactonase YvrE